MAALTFFGYIAYFFSSEETNKTSENKAFIFGLTGIVLGMLFLSIFIFLGVFVFEKAIKEVQVKNKV